MLPYFKGSWWIPPWEKPPKLYSCIWAAPAIVDLSRKLREDGGGLSQCRRYPDNHCSCGTTQWIVSFSGAPPGGTKPLLGLLLRPTAKEVLACTWGPCQHRSGCWADLCSSTQVDKPKATHSASHVLQPFWKYWQFCAGFKLPSVSGFCPYSPDSHTGIYFLCYNPWV